MATGIFSAPKKRASQLAVSQRSPRSIVFLLVITALISGCLFRLAQLQLVQGRYNRQLAEKNRISMIPIPADRGDILDQKGRRLAANRLTRAVYLAPREQTQQQWSETAARLGPTLNIPPSEILAKLKQVGYRSAMPVRIVRDLTPTAFVALSETIGQIPGVEIRAESSRYYPNGDMAAHVLGYIGEATLEDLKAHPEYPMGALVGQMGIERIANKTLQGVWGGHLVEVDAGGREVKMLGVKAAQPGSPLKLTIDLDLQKTAETALAKRRGAVVVMDVKTGAVLALASGPTFDPNLFTRRISAADWKQLQAEDKPFLNRALQGYPPGSTFKIVTASAGMQSGKFTPDSTVATSAFISLGGVQFHEHGGGGYGVIGFRDALAFSSNTFFYQVGLAAGPEQISEWAHRLGIGTSSNMNLDGGIHGSVPTPAQKEKLYGEPWYGGDTVSMSIGQGLVQVTPLEMAVMVSTIANGGFRVKPHLLNSQTTDPAMKPETTGLAPGTVAVIKAGLAAVVREGTARRLSDGSIPPTAGKTGTAEVPGQRDNALFVGFGPVDNPKIAVAVVVENGGYGAESAVPIAHEVYKTFFKAKPKSAAQRS
ncbi:penicillin-binding protein 2 [Leptolyngbya sp. FACHB-36]|uniref:penicillin-binding protein 2 n=1 Tax=Leptolyngbya sp. FACHB-36 TaxID=2692808 RepID=UPI001681595B|nr:penicillin-binding protein 2 [Leptolyngbya sp. FACHB-36]MBD2020056.1 penicillin-binding protein 2 [Leptolyngbya sp. FACHB-36]